MPTSTDTFASMVALFESLQESPRTFTKELPASSLVHGDIVSSDDFPDPMIVESCLADAEGVAVTGWNARLERVTVKYKPASSRVLVTRGLMDPAYAAYAAAVGCVD